MDQSEGVRNSYLRFCDRLSAGDVAAFDDLVSQEAKLVVGTSPGELVDDRPRMRGSDGSRRTPSASKP